MLRDTPFRLNTHPSDLDRLQRTVHKFSREQNPHWVELTSLRIVALHEIVKTVNKILAGSPQTRPHHAKNWPTFSFRI